MAIESHQDFQDILTSLNTSNATIRKKIHLNNAFKLNKCRLRCECVTRWSSAYLVLESVKRAYNKGMFNQNLDSEEN